jgi:hypothetical protein
MKIRHVFSTSTLAAAQDAIAAARATGVDDDAISLVARADIEMESIPEKRLDASADTVPAALRGAATGGAMGLLGGLVAVAIPAVGITVAGAGLCTLVGAAVGAWSSALMGSEVPNPVRRQFEAEIAAGRILIVIDDQRDHAAVVSAAMERAGAVALPFEHLTALS